MTPIQLRDINIFGWQESPAIPGGYRYHITCDHCPKYCGHVRDLIFEDQDDIVEITLRVFKEAHQAIINQCTPVDGFKISKEAKFENNFTPPTEPFGAKSMQLDTKCHVTHFQCPKCGEEMSVDIESTDPSTIFDKDFTLTISFNKEESNDDV